MSRPKILFSSRNAKLSRPLIALAVGLTTFNIGISLHAGQIAVRPQSGAASAVARLSQSVRALAENVKSQTTPVAQGQPAANIWQIARSQKLALPLQKGHIVILKSRRQLQLWNDKTLLKTYSVSLGGNPVGPKELRGDEKTPEGDFFICTRNPVNSSFHIFLGLSYPALPDAARGLGTRAISWREFQLIQKQLSSRSVPSWSTRLGGWVGIHGGNGGAFAQRRTVERRGPDWTGGCIAVTDKEIEELFAATRMGTPVSIRG